MLYKTYLCNFNVAYRYCIKDMNGKFLHGMLVSWFYGGIRTLIVLVMDYYSETCLGRESV